ncbi:MAG: type IV secretory system conjugative DNA transfer family protein, partial [Pirellulales bacterium]|nr:type IV secretory system conjugative DNA transfer family protein [Pirellulales bacterium]
MISLYAWSTGARLVYCVLGRLLGFYHYAHFRFFLWTPWRPFFRLWVPIRDWARKFRYGKRPQARLASFWEKASLTAGRRAFPLGRLDFKHITLFQMVGIKPKAHLMIFGGTGGGKTVAITTALAAHKGSSIVIDPSAQVTNVLQASCGRGGPGVPGKGQPSYCLDPDGYRRGPNVPPSHKWNIFDEWDRIVAVKGPSVLVKLSFILAEGLVIKEKGEKPYFPDTSKRMAEGLSLFVYDEYDPGDPRRSLVQFRHLLSNGLDEPERLRYKLSPFEWLLFRMTEKGDKYGGVIAARARQVQEGSRQGSGDVLSTLRTQTAWLDLEELQNISRSSDFSFLDFKPGPAHLSICAAVTDVQDKYAGWFR